MASKLFVGNLSYKIDNDQLQELFSQAGQVVSAVVITDKDTGRARGFGFVEMSNEKEAKKAIEMLNGKEHEGRTLVVNEARPRRED